MTRINSVVGGIAATLLLWGLSPAALAAGRIFSVEPSTVQQGDTVLLTIRGESLPTGNLRLEFFPQQIAVLSASLSSNKAELTAQVRIPPLATPGAYNVIVSNQLGEEAFGQALLTVQSTVRTPVFKDYDPKVIARADNGFALMLTGDLVTPEAAPQLSVSWEQGGAPVGGLRSEFSHAGSSIICAVTGRLPTGMLRGKVNMAGKPIYQLEVEVRGGTAVIGHVPASIYGAAGPMSLALIGDDLSSAWLSRAKVALRDGRREVPASRVVLRESAKAEVVFNGPLPPGNWQLSVAIDGVGVYQGAVTVLPPLPAPLQPEPPQQFVELQQQGASENFGVGSEPEIPEPVQPTVITEIGEYNPISLPTVSPDQHGSDQVELPAGFQMTEVHVAPAPTLTLVRSATLSAEPGGSPRLVLTGSSLTADVLERLDVSLTHSGGLVLPTFSSATGNGSLIYLFPELTGISSATIVARDRLGQASTFRQRIDLNEKVSPVAVGTPESASVEPAVPPAVQVSLEGMVRSSAEGMSLTLLGVPAGLDWAQASLSTPHPILAPNTAKFALEAPLSGSRTLLNLVRDKSALPDAVYSVLSDVLCDSGAVPLVFSWPDGTALGCEAHFEKAPDIGTGTLASTIELDGTQR